MHQKEKDRSKNRLCKRAFKPRLYTAIIGPFSYLDQCDLMVQPQKYSVIFSRMHFVTFICKYNMHQDTKSARLTAVCKRSFTACSYEEWILILTWFHMGRNSSHFPGIARESTGANTFQPIRTSHVEHSSWLNWLAW